MEQVKTVFNYKVNERINANRVILIDHNGNNCGEVSKYNALQLARNEGLDLVEVKSDRVPICKIMNFGKFLYDKKKIEKHKNHAPSVKEVWFNYTTEPHDLNIKLKKIKTFLEDKHRVIVGMKVSGRSKFLAKDHFFNIVKDLSPKITLNDIIENDKYYSITIYPL